MTIRQSCGSAIKSGQLFTGLSNTLYTNYTRRVNAQWSQDHGYIMGGRVFEETIGHMGENEARQAVHASITAYNPLIY
jgi:hypothetical protein